jgi:hypothetical protein
MDKTSLIEKKSLIVMKNLKNYEKFVNENIFSEDSIKIMLEVPYDKKNEVKKFFDTYMNIENLSVNLLKETEYRDPTDGNIIISVPISLVNAFCVKYRDSVEDHTTQLQQKGMEVPAYGYPNDGDSTKIAVKIVDWLYNNINKFD